MTTHGRSGIGTRLFLWILRRIFSLRYRVRVRGLDEVAARGTRGILFLSNHPALLDPAMLTMWLYPRFSTRALADAVQINRPVVGWLARKFGTRVMPSLDREGPAGVEPVRRVLAEAIAGLQQGENLLLYPAGHMKRRTAEEIGAASAARAILDGAPDLRVVLIRQNGFWGSSFSYGLTGQPPSLAGGFKRGFKYLLLNLIFFVPRRPVDVELVEPSDLPRAADRLVLNRYLETFYNAGAARNRYVPYGFWERGGIREVPDPPGARKGSDVGSVPAAIQQQVVEQLVQVSGKPTPVVTDELANDLGLDSLAVAELVTWVESEFGFSVGSPDSLVTVGDVMVAAAGRGVSAAETEIRSAGASWFAERGSERLELPPGSTVTEVFLRQASLGPDRVILADQTSGERTYRDLVLVMMLLKPLVEKLPGEYVGIMMPASVGAAVFYLTALFAGKTPVMVNWTTGSRNLTHSLDLLGVTHVITARALVDRLAALGTDVSALGDRFVFAEDLRAQMSIGQKLSALVRSRFSWRSLWRAKPTETAVVLFTSGSESMPKAVPLTHGNILTNIRDTLAAVSVIKSDVLIGMLPPFHSFGIVETICLTTLSSMRAVYHPNPTESAVLARVVEAYQVTLLVGTPTFLNGVVRVAQPRELDSLRLAVTGAEKCPESIYASIEERCPQLTVIEGYGITECSPIVSINPIEAPVRGASGDCSAASKGSSWGSSGRSACRRERPACCWYAAPACSPVI